jgi:hypothetical protein
MFTPPTPLSNNDATLLEHLRAIRQPLHRFVISAVIGLLLAWQFLKDGDYETI